MAPTDAVRLIAVFTKMPFSMLASVSGGRALAELFVLYLTIVVNLIAHELGHGLFANLARVQIKGFRIGGGARAVRWRWRRLDFEFGWAVWKGARINLGDLPNSRWKQIMVYSGGVFGNLAVVPLVWLALPLSAWLECIVVTIVSVAFAVQNVIPGAPDGKEIWQLVGYGIASLGRYLKRVP